MITNEIQWVVEDSSDVFFRWENPLKKLDLKIWLLNVNKKYRILGEQAFDILRKYKNNLFSVDFDQTTQYMIEMQRLKHGHTRKSSEHSIWQ